MIADSTASGIESQMKSLSGIDVRTGLVPLRQYPTICRGRAEKS
jgi:hypothetical protein